MSIEVISIGSSSSGNSYIIRAGGKVLLLDVGLTAKRIMAALADEGIEPESVDAVLVTHEHIDHVKSVRAISRKCCNAAFYASRGTIEHTANFQYVPGDRVITVKAGDVFVIGVRRSSDDVTIKAFALSHDASEPIGYTVSCGDDKLAIVTDTGIITDEIYNAISDANMLVFEANHDEDLLMFGEYPYPVKIRIKGDHGHLSNRYAGELLGRIMNDRSAASDALIPLRIMLAHLSFHNNAPFMARTTIESILQESGYEKDVHYILTIAAKDEITVF